MYLKRKPLILFEFSLKDVTLTTLLSILMYERCILGYSKELNSL